MAPYNSSVLAHGEGAHTPPSAGGASNTSDCAPQHDLFHIAMSHCVTKKSAEDVGALRKQISTLRKIHYCKLFSVSTWTSYALVKETENSFWLSIEGEFSWGKEGKSFCTSGIIHSVKIHTKHFHCPYELRQKKNSSFQDKSTITCWNSVKFPLSIR